jgi:hypothetical protein
VAQQPIADGMEGAGPLQALQQRLPHPADGFIECLLDDVVGAPAHFRGGTAREGQHQDACRIDAVDREVCDSVCERVGLAGACTRHDQERPGL